PAGTSCESLSYTSSDDNVASVDGSGFVTGKSSGTAEITVTCDSLPPIKTNVNVKTYLKDIGVVESSVQLNLANKDGEGKVLYSINYTPNPTVFDGTISCESSHPDIVEVVSQDNGKCQINGKAIGESDITISYSEKSEVKQTVKVVVVNDQALERIELNVSTIELDANPFKVPLNNTYQLEPVLFPDTATNKEIEYSTGSSGIVCATVSQDGLITAVKTGIITITVTSKQNPDVNDFVVVTVTNSKPESITLSDITIDTESSETSKKIPITIGPAGTNCTTLTYESLNPSVATVDASSGVVTAAATQGTATIKATCDDLTAEGVVTLLQHATSVNITNGDSANLNLANKDGSGKLLYTINYELLPSGNTDTAKCESSDEALVEVVSTSNSECQINAKAVGTPTVTISSTERPDVKSVVSFNIVNNVDANRIDGIPATITLDVNTLRDPLHNTRQLEPQVFPVGATTPTTYSVTPSGVVSVSSSGLITAENTGVATVTVTNGSVSVQTEVTVETSLASSITLDETSKTLDYIRQETYKIEPNVLPASAASSIKCESSEPLKVSVEGCTIKAVGAGSAIITVSSIYDSEVKATLNVAATKTLEMYFSTKNTVVLSESGANLYAWGDSNNYATGLGTVVDQNSPQPPHEDSQLQGKIVSHIAGGNDGFVALTTEGKLYGWGPTRISSLEDSYVQYPKLNPTLENITITKLVSGSFAISDTGKLYSWGYNTHGVLGLGDETGRKTPEQVTALDSVVVSDVITQNTATYAITNAGKVYAWGNNENGQLGIGSTDNRATPQLITALQDKIVSKIIINTDNNYYAAQVFAITSDNLVYSWGKNTNGELGIGSNTDSTTPQLVTFTGLGDGEYIADIIGGGYTLDAMYAITNKGRVYSWGDNQNGQLGHNDTTARNTPTIITALDGKTVTKVIRGYYAVYAITTENKLYSWGRYYDGGLGRTNVDTYIPVAIDVFNGKVIKDFIVQRNWAHQFVLTNDGKLYSWGDNASHTDGVLGLESSDNMVYTPTLIPALSDKVVTKIYYGDQRNMYAITNDNTVYAWGSNYSCQLGVGLTDGSCQNKSAPTLITFP
ncbi:MAG: Ig-like domain-containing protein, partial [Deferribacterales bacterium]|nr:Ig-like domain-containing protein [Deferribacterales bacterium]